MRYMIPSQASLHDKLRRGTLEFCILALLSRKPSYGLELSMALKETPSLFGSEGTLYPLLSRMRKQGWLGTTWQESSAGPPRRYYHLTEDGQLALDTFIQAWAPFRSAVDQVLGGIE